MTMPRPTVIKFQGGAGDGHELPLSTPVKPEPLFTHAVGGTTQASVYEFVDESFEGDVRTWRYRHIGDVERDARRPYETLRRAQELFDQRRSV